MDASFLTGSNATFIAELYATYLKTPGAVDPSWAAFFNELDEEEAALFKSLEGASWAPSDATVIGADDDSDTAAAKSKSNGKDASKTNHLTKGQAEASIAALQLIRAYRARGHQVANQDPLKLQKSESHPELEYQTHGFTDDDLDKEIQLAGVLGLEKATLREIISTLKETYCGTIGVEFTHVQDPAQKSWLQKRIESDHLTPRFSKDGKKAILERLNGSRRFREISWHQIYRNQTLRLRWW